MKPFKIKSEPWKAPAGHQQRTGMGPHKKQDEKRKADKLRKEIRDQNHD